eukprot:68320-Pleurochrysis_carterae.AAC.4
MRALRDTHLYVQEKQVFTPVLAVNQQAKCCQRGCRRTAGALRIRRMGSTQAEQHERGELTAEAARSQRPWNACARAKVTLLSI